MEKRWYKVWPNWVPKVFEVEKSVCEYLRDWASMTPRRVALSFYRDAKIVETYEGTNEIDKLIIPKNA